MDVYIARQPILTRAKKLFGYELLFRGTEDFGLADISGDRATTSLLSSTFFTKGIDVISGDKPCFVNFTEELLKEHVPQTFPQAKIVVEILEDVRPTPEVIDVCHDLIKRGYAIALDDFVYDKSMTPLIECADIIKIDVQLTPLATLSHTLEQLAKYKKRLLAEKVETHEDFQSAAQLGFTLFQGYFFSRPEEMCMKELSPLKVNLLHLLSEIVKRSTTLDKLCAIITADVAMSYKLLRYLNSAYYYRLEKVKNVKNAIAYLGERELRKFLLVIILSELAMDAPGELVRLALVRAKFCELLAEDVFAGDVPGESFLVGLFSLIDTMLNMPMNEVMSDIPVSDVIRQALVCKKGTPASLLDIVIAYERSHESLVFQHVDAMNIDRTQVPAMYLKALEYANNLCK